MGDEPKHSIGSITQGFKQRPWKQDKCSWPYQLELSPKGSGHGGQTTVNQGDLRKRKGSSSASNSSQLYPTHRFEFRPFLSSTFFFIPFLGLSLPCFSRPDLAQAFPVRPFLSSSGRHVICYLLPQGTVVYVWQTSSLSFHSPNQKLLSGQTIPRLPLPLAFPKYMVLQLVPIQKKSFLTKRSH